MPPARLPRLSLKPARTAADADGMRQQAIEPIKPRRHLRLRMLTTDPVYIVATVGNLRVDMLAADLGGGGACLDVPQEYRGRFEVGAPLGQALLVLPDVGLPIVTPIVRWDDGAHIGVEFTGVTERQKEMIYKFLFQVERNTVRYIQ